MRFKRLLTVIYIILVLPLLLVLFPGVVYFALVIYVLDLSYDDYDFWKSVLKIYAKITPRSIWSIVISTEDKEGWLEYLPKSEMFANINELDSSDMWVSLKNNMLSKHELVAIIELSRSNKLFNGSRSANDTTIETISLTQKIPEELIIKYHSIFDYNFLVLNKHTRKIVLKPDIQLLFKLS